MQIFTPLSGHNLHPWREHPISFDRRKTFHTILPSRKLIPIGPRTTNQAIITITAIQSVIP